MSIRADIQALAAGTLVELFEIDLSTIGINEQYYFHNGVNEELNNVVWQGKIYTRFPIEVSGFEFTGSGQQPRPIMRIANIDGLLGAIAKTNEDLIGVRFVRRRTFLKYLDAVNFPGGNLNADPNVSLPDEIYFIDRKSDTNQIFLEFELASAFDLEGIQLPRRQCIQNVCTWKYRSAECSYAGPAVADRNDVGTNVMSKDACGKRLKSCKLRFGNAPLPYGGFISIGLIK